MALTKVAGDILDPGIVVAGIVTATGFSGPFSNGTTGNFSGDVTVGGSLIVQGDQTTLNTTLRNVELLRVAANSSTAAGIITQTGSGDILNLFDGAAEVFSVADGGNVEINAGNLTLVKSSGALLELTTNTGAADATLRLSEGSKGSTTNGGGMFYSGADNKLYVTCGTDSTTKRITVVRDSGNVGINTTTPQTELEVFSDGFANLTIHSARTSGNIGGFDFSNGASAAGIQTAQYFVGTAGHHYWHCNGSERLKLENDGDLTITGVDNAELKLKCEASTGNNILAFLNSAGATKGRILYDSDNNFMVFNTNGTSDERMRITNAGAVGIGTNDPDTRLSVTAAVGTDVVGKFTSTDARAWIQFRDNSTTDTGVMVGAEGDNLLLRAGSNTRVTIDSSGHVLPNAAGTQNLGSTSKEWGDLYFANSKGLKLGSSQVGDLYNDGTDTYFRNSASNGQMLLRSDGNILISNYAANEYRIKTFNNGAVELYYDQSAHTTAKLSTTATGISVHGEVAATQDYPTLRPTLDCNFVLNKTLDPRFEYYSYGPASYVDENGKVVFVTDGIPRFDHDPVTRECKGLLIEGERSNKIPHSFDNGNWSAGSGGATLTRNAGIAPDGTMTATKVLSANNDIDVNPQLGPASPGATGQIAISGSVTYTLSIWAKASTTAQIGNNFKVRWKRVQGNAAFAETTFALTADWRRYSATTTTASNNSTIACYIGGVSGSEALVWGAQLESGTTASSLIPTYGYSVTRGPDVIEMQGEEFTDFYNQNEGTIFLSASYETDARAVAIVTIDDTSNAGEYTEVGYRAGGASSGQVSSYIRTTSGNDQYYKNWSSSATQGNEFKIALGYKDDNYASSANGETVHTDTSGTTSRLYDRLRFSQVHSVGHGGVGHYRRLMYYSKRITNSQLVTLTS